MVGAGRFLLVLPLMALLFFVDPSRTQGSDSVIATGSGPSLTTSFVSVPPTIDGALSSGEWGSPLSISLNGFNDPSIVRTGELYLRNSSTDLFVALVLSEPVASASDIAEINIDADHDHKATAGKEDALRFENGAVDLFWQGSDWAADSSQHGMVARSYSNGKYAYEFRKPLNSGDSQDMAVSPGRTIGFRIQTRDADISEFFRYPPGTRGHGDTTVEWGKWADLAIATPPVSTAPTLQTPADRAQLTAMTTTLTWSNPSSTTQVHVRVTPANSDGPGVNLILGATTSLRIPPPPEWYGLLPGMSYSWKTRASAAPTALDENSLLWGPWSEDRSFRTPVRDSTRLTPVSPSDGGIVTTAPQVLQWNNGDPDIFYYEVQVSPDQQFGAGGPVASVWHNLVHGGLPNRPPNSWDTPALAPGTTYFWRVRPRVQGDGTSVAWGPTRSFRTQ